MGGPHPSARLTTSASSSSLPKSRHDHGKKQPKSIGFITAIYSAVSLSVRVYKTPTSSSLFCPQTTPREPPGCSYASTKHRHGRRRKSPFPMDFVDPEPSPFSISSSFYRAHPPDKVPYFLRPRSSYPCSTEGHRPLELFRRAIGGGPVHNGARNLATATSTTSSSSGYDPFVPGPRRLARRRYADTSPPHLRPPVRFPASRAARFSWFGSGPSDLDLTVTFYSFREEVPANHRGPRQHPVTAQSAPRHR